MKQLCACIALLCGIWLGLSPWVLGYGSTPMLISGLTTGAVIVVAALVVVIRPPKLKLGAPLMVIVIASLWSLVSGLGVFGAIHPSEIIIGALTAFITLFAIQIVEGKKAAIFTKDGKVLVEMTAMAPQEGRIEMKGKTFGTMPATMYFPPQDLWNMIGMIPFSVIRQVPKLLFNGWQTTRRASTASATVKH